MSLLENLILFSPLLVLGLLILVVLEYADKLRYGAGLRVPPPMVVAATTGDGDDGVGKEADEGDMQEVEEAGEGEAEEEGEQEEEEEGGAEQEVGAEEEIEVEEEDYEIIPYGSSGGGDDDDGGAGTAGPSGGAGNPNHQPPPHAAAPPQQPPPSRVAPRTRNIGPKKAASLARRDQRRAYNEFQRSQALSTAEATRDLERSLAEAVFAEKQRRAVAEEEIAERRERERLDRLEREKEEDRRRSEDMCTLKDVVVRALSTGKKRVWRLSELAECVPGRAEAWVKDALERAGLLGVVVVVGQEGGGLGSSSSNSSSGGSSTGAQKRWQVGMVTGKGYYVVVGMADIQRLFSALDRSGEKGMSWGQMGREMQDILGLVE